jgi:hypothetical protein
LLTLDRTYLANIVPRRQPPARHEISRLQVTCLRRQHRVRLFQIIREDVRFRVEMPQLLILPLAALPGIAQRTHDEPHLVEPIRNLGRGIGDVLALLYFEVVGVFADGFVQLSCLCVVGGSEKRGPEIGNAEDEVGALEGRRERCWVMEVGGEHLDAFGGQGLGYWGCGVAGETADLPLRVLEEDIGDRSALEYVVRRGLGNENALEWIS